MSSPPPGGREPTRDDVAKAAGVSASTVSYVMADGPRPVSEATRKRVLAAMKELGYRPNAVARNLRRRQTSTIGLLLPGLVNPYFADVAEGVETAAAEAGFTVVLCQSGFDHKRELRCIEALIDDRIAGLVWVPLGDSEESIVRLTQFAIPMVLLDRVPVSMLDPVRAGLIRLVSTDNVLGGELATRHLLELGHRRIGLISMTTELTHNRGRLIGHQRALEEAGIPFDESLVVEGGYGYEHGRSSALRLLDTPDPPTAILANYDVLAIGAIAGIAERGLRVPDDISIVGFDDIEAARFAQPPLTTVAQPKEEMGRRGVEVLAKLINDDEPPPGTAEMSVELVVRKSTGPVAKRGRSRRGGAGA
jgi:LacI family transcriptional regulator